MPNEVATAIEAMPASQRWGSLCFYGEWFGGRPYDNQHTLTGVEGDEALVILSFDEGETLAVENPRRVTVSEDGLRIGRASRVRWEWFHYGRPKTPENRFVIEYRVGSTGVIEVTDTADWYEPLHQPSPSADAVALLKGVPR
jgi:hypothetical protein